ncbi:MAG TPA: glycosyltransferase [Chloroflexia bacterium]|nr:glycosyltransferase [Chloroflexia bacterium]
MRSVAVAIPTMNRPEHLGRCIRSILDGDLRPDQLVVCDQSTSGNTAAMLSSLEPGDVELTYLHLNRPNASAARNSGFEAARTELVAYIDDDCVPAKGWLAALAGSYYATAGSERVASVTGRVLPLRSVRRGVALSSRSSRRKRFFRADGGSLEKGEWAPWDAGTGGNLLSPRRTLAELGGFNVELGPGTPTRAAEDIDLLYRLARVGTLVYEPEAVVYHPMGSRRKRITSRYAYGRGMGSMLALHLSRGEPAAQSLLSLYLRHQAAQAFRRGLWGPAESLLLLAGAAGPLVKYRLQRFSVEGNDKQFSSRSRSTTAGETNR